MILCRTERLPVVTCSFPSFWPMILANEPEERWLKNPKGTRVISIFPLLVPLFPSVHCVWMEPIWWKWDRLMSHSNHAHLCTCFHFSHVVVCCTHDKWLLIDFWALLEQIVAKLKTWEWTGFSTEEDVDLCFQNGWWWSWSSMAEWQDSTSHDSRAMTHIFLALSNLSFVLVSAASLMIPWWWYINPEDTKRNGAYIFFPLCQPTAVKTRNRNKHKELNIIMSFRK